MFMREETYPRCRGYSVHFQWPKLTNRFSFPIDRSEESIVNFQVRKSVLLIVRASRCHDNNRVYCRISECVRIKRGLSMLIQWMNLKTKWIVLFRWIVESDNFNEYLDTRTKRILLCFDIYILFIILDGTTIPTLLAAQFRNHAHANGTKKRMNR